MGMFSSKNKRELNKSFAGKPCGICGTGIPSNKGKLTIDHIIPRSKGGSSKLFNLQPAHSTCNRKKGNK